jgi:flagellar basal-body rod modification protein FlgD
VIGEIATTSLPGGPMPTNPGGKLGKDEFLKMLVAQLKNQDPMNPMKGDDMAAQLAQFSSLEQLTNIGGILESQAGLQADLIGTINDATAMNALGRTVLAVGDQVEVAADGTGTVHFEVGGQGGLAMLRILDESGRQVGTRPLGFVSPGKHSMELGAAADGLEPGRYRYAVEAADTAGKVVPVQPFVSAKVDGVRYGPQGPVFTSGSLRIPFGTILQIATD